MSEANKALIRQYLETFNQDYRAALDKYVADEELRQHIPHMQAVFPGYQLVADDVIAEGDKVVVRATMHGTHQGEGMGIPPTGKHVTVPMIIVYRITDAKIVEHWIVADQLGLMQQLGAVPA